MIPLERMTAPHFYSSFEIDRCDGQRDDRDWLAERLESAETRVVAVWRDKSLAAAGDAPAAYLVEAAHVVARVGRGPLTLLGTAHGVTYFGVDLSDVDDPIADLGLGDVARFDDLRKLGPFVSHTDGALLSYARAMAYWQRRHRFCGTCGSPTESRRSGHLRVCTNASCGAQHFPRTDPAVIMRVTHGDACLLGRQSHWLPLRYSVLAGFVEPGEDLESAVAREVHEVAGVRVEDVRYHSSQPWPFPASLMVGFTARATSRELRVNRDEMEDARWFTRDEVRRGVERGELALSPVDSISRRLVDEWLVGDA
jgi:NAD+ diphosphatase